MTAQQKITREVLENYLHCKTKGFLTLARVSSELSPITRHGAWKQVLEKKTAWRPTSSPIIEGASYKKMSF